MGHVSQAISKRKSDVTRKYRVDKRRKLLQNTSENRMEIYAEVNNYTFKNFCNDINTFQSLNLCIFHYNANVTLINIQRSGIS